MKLSRVKFLVLLLGVCLLVAFLLTASVQAIHAGHHCMNEVCQVCACLNHSRSLLRFLNGLLLYGFTAALLTGPGCELSRGLLARAIPDTPVLLRVRMNQ